MAQDRAARLPGPKDPKDGVARAFLEPMRFVGSLLSHPEAWVAGTGLWRDVSGISAEAGVPERVAAMLPRMTVGIS